MPIRFAGLSLTFDISQKIKLANLYLLSGFANCELMTHLSSARLAVTYDLSDELFDYTENLEIIVFVRTNIHYLSSFPNSTPSSLIFSLGFTLISPAFFPHLIRPYRIFNIIESNDSS